jgi:hypothetical protein
MFGIDPTVVSPVQDDGRDCYALLDSLTGSFQSINEAAEAISFSFSPAAEARRLRKQLNLFTSSDVDFCLQTIETGEVELTAKREAVDTLFYILRTETPEVAPQAAEGLVRLIQKQNISTLTKGEQKLIEKIIEVIPKAILFSDEGTPTSDLAIGSLLQIVEAEEVGFMVKSSIVKALSKMVEKSEFAPQVTECLINLIQQRDVKLDQKLIEEIMEIIQKAMETLQEDCSFILSTTGTLTQIAKSKETAPFIRAYLFSLIAEADAPKNVDALLSIARDREESEDIKITAIDILADIPLEAFTWQSLETLISIVRQNDESLEIRGSASYSLALIAKYGLRYKVPDRDEQRKRLNNALLLIQEDFRICRDLLQAAREMSKYPHMKNKVRLIADKISQIYSFKEEILAKSKTRKPGVVINNNMLRRFLNTNPCIMRKQ